MPEPGPASLTLLLQPASLHTGSVPVMCARGAQSPGDTRPLSQVTLLSDVQRAPGPPGSWPPCPLFAVGPTRQREGVPAASKPLCPSAGPPLGGQLRVQSATAETLKLLPWPTGPWASWTAPSSAGGRRSRSSTSCLRTCLRQTLEPLSPGTPAACSLGTGATSCPLTGDRSRAASTPEATCQCLCPGHARVAGSHQAAPGLGHSLRTRPHTP